MRRALHERKRESGHWVRLTSPRQRQTLTVRLLQELVDRLPARLWKTGNLYRLPAGDWHFCAGRHPTLSRRVRTIEWRSRQIAHGQREFRLDADEDA